jgi:DNA-binding transcriptional ArsR family regulator
VEVDLALPAALIGDPTRATILLALSEKEALPASELAQRAGVGNSTASIQLGKLVEGRLLEVERHGRHRYYRLAGPAVAQAIEALAVIAPARPARSARDSGIQVARTCYDHLAGALGVAFLDTLVAGGILVRDNGSVDLSGSGTEQLESLGVDVEGIRHSRRAFAKLCLDWSERRYHLAGGLGAALTSRLFELGWIERAGPTRAVRVTAAGRMGLRSSFGLEPPS